MELTFLLPRKIVFGRGSAATVGEEAKELEGSRTLLVTSRGMLRRDGYARVVQSLERSDVAFNISTDIVPEPIIESVDDCIATARQGPCDLVIGLGGGSVLDVAKKTAADLKLPMIMVPTTAGTGSEVTHESVLKVDGRKKAFVDRSLLPEVAIVDPDLADTMPPCLAVSSGIDALAHALECWQSRRSNPIVAALAKDAFTMLKENISRSIEGDKQARSNMCLGSLMAGMAFGNSGTALGHALSYPLANRGVPHGMAVAMALPYVLEFNGAETAFVEEMDSVVRIADLKWNRDWDIAEMTSEVMGDTRHLGNNPREVGRQDVSDMFHRMSSDFAAGKGA